MFFLFKLHGCVSQKAYLVVHIFQRGRGFSRQQKNIAVESHPQRQSFICIRRNLPVWRNPFSFRCLQCKEMACNWINLQLPRRKQTEIFCVFLRFFLRQSDGLSDRRTPYAEGAFVVIWVRHDHCGCCINWGGIIGKIFVDFHFAAQNIDEFGTSLIFNA